MKNPAMILADVICGLLKLHEERFIEVPIIGTVTETMNKTKEWAKGFNYGIWSVQTFDGKIKICIRPKPVKCEE